MKATKVKDKTVWQVLEEAGCRIGDASCERAWADHPIHSAGSTVWKSVFRRRTEIFRENGVEEIAGIPGVAVYSCRLCADRSHYKPKAILQLRFVVGCALLAGDEQNFISTTQVEVRLSFVFH